MINKFLLCCLLLLAFVQLCAADMRSPITVHVLDQHTGEPAANIQVSLSYSKTTEKPVHMESVVTDMFGRGDILTPLNFSQSATNPNCCFESPLSVGYYVLVFKTGDYIKKATGKEPFFPEQTIIFTVTEDNKYEYFHVPMLLSANSFTTYRGS